MLIREGLRVPDIVKALQHLVQTGRNTRNGLRHDVDVARRQFLSWVDEAERQLRGIFPAPEVADRLLTDRYWHVQTFVHSAGSTWLFPVMAAEMEFQMDRLTRIADILDGLSGIADRPGNLTVLDANVYVHGRSFEQVQWDEEMGCKGDTVRLIMPILVLEELDKIKYMKGDRQAAAMSVLRVIDGLHEQTSRQGFAQVRRNVTFEIVDDLDGHERRSNPDDEIIERARFLKQLTGRPATLVSIDRYMRVRSEARGVAVWQLPDHLRRTPPTSAP